MFSQACVIPSAQGGGACMAKGGVHGKEGCVWQGGHAWWGEACVAKGGMHCRGGGIGGLCVAGEMATAADGTHPTGMHSCWLWDDI